MVNEKGGVPDKYKVEANPADTQAKADIAINKVGIPHTQIGIGIGAVVAVVEL